MLDMIFDIVPGAGKICAILQSAGFQAYLVGGCVRDLLLGKTPKDWDLCTNAIPQQISKLFDKTLPTGLQHGTITVCLGQGIENHFEVTTFRIDGKYNDGRRPEMVYFVEKIEEDLARRDLTINAMAYDPISQTLIDPFGGQQDLQNKQIRTVGDASDRFQEDGLRIMRAARFAAQLEYIVDPTTWQAMKDNLDTLQKVSRERIKDELWKILATRNPLIGLLLLRDCGVLAQIDSEWARQENLRYLQDVDAIPMAEIETKFAVLCCNFASTTLERIGKELKLSNLEMKKIRFLLNTLEQFPFYLHNPTAHQARIFLAYLKNNAPANNSITQFFFLSEAIGLEAEQEMVLYQNEIVWARSELQINGNDLLVKGLVGPAIKTALDKCYQEILREPSHNTRQFLLTFI
jgi:tRNA nucleotidyltransferase (CCA-adding enzyme)